METFVRKACAVSLLGGAAMISVPAFAQVSGAAPSANAGQSRAVDMTEQKAQAAQNDAATTLNNTPSAGGSANAAVTAQGAGTSAKATGATRHAMGVGNSGGNNAPAATNDAQSQAGRELNQQPPGPNSGNMK